ncbi:HAD-IIA family hydrolase [Mobilicoccus pelagius]|uniref:Putative hydrolase n=1 Tax=Mobilicoccus pelagius NBRC 104925 TaxID=1089455 RepID=H5UV73_9MICO|nr:HAD-IIA family hydrolase [Mobilicoccus pelagius]GAB49631.1 putative hydrolase [Mobilicoccus pelagius NBRC 104925]
MTSLVERYRGIVCDLDGVVYSGHDALPHAVDALNAARAGGRGLVFATNNASRPPEEVHRHLSELGVDLRAEDVVTSSMAGAQRLAEVLDEGAVVLAVGGPGVPLSLERAGLRPVTSADLAAGESPAPAAVLQGYGRDVAWTDLAEAAHAVAGGARWVATNTDLTIPTARGIAPGNGTLVGAVGHAVGVDPEVVGKPHPPLYLLCAELLGCEAGETLAIGDRLDTDIKGATATGMDSLFVLTGVHGAHDVVLAPADARPTHVARDLRDLHEDPTPAHVTHDDAAGETVATCGDARVRIGTSIDLDGAGSATERLRAVAAAGHAHLDAGRELPAWPDVDAWIHEGET